MSGALSATSFTSLSGGDPRGTHGDLHAKGAARHPGAPGAGRLRRGPAKRRLRQPLPEELQDRLSGEFGSSLCCFFLGGVCLGF